MSYIKMFSHMLKCTKFYQLDIIKNKNMALKKMLAEGIKIFLKKKRKTETVLT